MNWTAERTAEAVKHWNDGLTAAAIAEILGGGVSRCSVISRMHRLRGGTQGGELWRGSSRKGAGGIAVRKPAGGDRVPGAKRPQGKRVPTEAQKNARARFQTGPRKAPTHFGDVPGPDEATRTPFMDLASRQCRHPVEGSGMHMVCCGGEQAPGSSYCAHHHALNYRSASASKLKADVAAAEKRSRYSWSL